MKTSKIVSPIIFWLGMFLGAQVGAQDSSAKNPYSEDFWSRSTLTGDWGGLRTELAAKGVTLDVSITQVGQGVVGGGKNGAWEYGGRGDFILNLDSGKLGLWPSGFFNFEMEGNWASSVNSKTGALMPVNSNQLYPLAPGDIFGVPAWNFTQYVSPHLGVTIGKFATITANSGDMNEFAHGKGDSNFMNMALNLNPLTAFTTPYSTLGTGLLVSPTKDSNAAVLSFFVMSANGNPTTSGFESLNGNAVIVTGEGRMRTEFLGLTGHQLFGTTFSNKKFTSIDQRFNRDTIENSAPKAKKGSWNIYYNFDQYLYEPKKGALFSIVSLSNL